MCHIRPIPLLAFIPPENTLVTVESITSHITRIRDMFNFKIAPAERLCREYELRAEALNDHLDSLEDTILFLREDIRDFRAKLIQFEELRETLSSEPKTA